jgi:hypothetical protein
MNCSIKGHQVIRKSGGRILGIRVIREKEDKSF